MHGQIETVAPHVGEFDHFVTLIMMTEDEHPLSESGSRGDESLAELGGDRVVADQGRDG
jgi:hypothetical protein